MQSKTYRRWVRPTSKPLWLDLLRYFLLSSAFFSPLPGWAQNTSGTLFTGESIDLPCFQGQERPDSNGSQLGDLCALGVSNCNQLIPTLQTQLDSMYDDWVKTAYRYKVHYDHELARQFFDPSITGVEAPGFPLPGDICDALADPPHPAETTRNRAGRSCDTLETIHITFYGATIGFARSDTGERINAGEKEQSYLNGFYKRLLKENYACAKKEIEETKRLRLSPGMEALARDIEKLYERVNGRTDPNSRTFLPTLDPSGEGSASIRNLCQQQNLLENPTQVVERYCSEENLLTQQFNEENATNSARQLQSACYLATAGQHINQAIARLIGARVKIITDIQYQSLTQGYDSAFETAIRNFVNTFRTGDIDRAVRANLIYCADNIPCDYDEAGMRRDAARFMSESYNRGILQVITQFYQDHLGKPCP